MYFITCFQKLGEDELGRFEAGAIRTFGYYEELEDAKNALSENIGDMHECLYEYGVIEEIGEGIHYFAHNRWFFKYDEEKDGFFEIEEPKEVNHICNFALG